MIVQIAFPTCFVLCVGKGAKMKKPIKVTPVPVVLPVYKILDTCLLCENCQAIVWDSQEQSEGGFDTAKTMCKVRSFNPPLRPFVLGSKKCPDYMNIHNRLKELYDFTGKVKAELEAQDARDCDNI
jgi:hypothetical protein